MFGYIRPFKPMLRVCEYEGFRSVYCGVCKAVGRNFGTLPRLSLTYDSAALALFDMSLNSIPLKAEKQRCIVHPLVKRNCAVSDGLDYSAYVQVILTYHKLKDDIADGGLKEKLYAEPALTALSGAYQKARDAYPRLAAVVEKQTKAMERIQNEKNPSVDLACEPTGRIMKAVFSELGHSPEQKAMLGSFGYFVGRFIYLVDALDDLRKDCISDSYNPIALKLGLSGELTEEQFKKACDSVDVSVRLTLGQLAEKYVKLDLRAYRSILDNIIYLGLNNVYEQVRKGVFSTKERNERI